MSHQQHTCSETGCARPVKTRGLCQKHYHATWRAENAEHVRETEREYAKANADGIREYQRQRYLANRDRILANERKRRAEDPDFRRRKSEYAVEWRNRDPELARVVARRSRIKRKYGLTLDEYDAILARGCAICGSHDGRVVGKRNGWEAPPARLCLDHDHATGKVRDALCHGCNAALGALGDNPARLRAAADYLESHAGSSRKETC